MSQENVARARESYGALQRAIESGEFEAYFDEFVDPQIEWQTLPESFHSGVCRGQEAVKQRLAEMLEPFDHPRIEAEEFIDGGDRTVIGVRLRGRGKDSGLEWDSRLYHVVTACEGKATRIEWYSQRAEALEAAGLRA